MSDYIKITGITGFGYHGMLSDEREHGQEFSVDLVLELDLHPAGTSDDLIKTVDYSDVAEITHQKIVGEPVNLIERLAEMIAEHILKEFAVSSIEVTVHKPNAPIIVPFSNVSVTIKRSRV